MRKQVWRGYVNPSSPQKRNKTKHARVWTQVFLTQHPRLHCLSVCYETISLASLPWLGVCIVLVLECLQGGLDLNLSVFLATFPLSNLIQPWEFKYQHTSNTCMLTSLKSKSSFRLLPFLSGSYSQLRFLNGISRLTSPKQNFHFSPSMPDFPYMIPRFKQTRNGGMVLEFFPSSGLTVFLWPWPLPTSLFLLLSLSLSY